MRIGIAVLLFSLAACVERAEPQKEPEKVTVKFASGKTKELPSNTGFFFVLENEELGSTRKLKKGELVYGDDFTWPAAGQLVAIFRGPFELVVVEVVKNPNRGPYPGEEPK